MKEWIDTSSPARTDPQKLLFGLGLLPVVGVLIFAVSALVYQVSGTQLRMLGLAVATGLLILVPVMLDRARPASRRHVMLSLMSLAYGVRFVSPIFTRYLLEDPRAPAVHLGVGDVFLSNLLAAQGAALVGFVALLTGYALPVGRGLAGLFPEPRHEWPDRTAIRVAVIGLPLGWAFYFASILGIIPSSVGTGVFEPLTTFPITAITLLVLVYLRSRSRAALLLLAVLIPITMFFNFFSGSKGKFLAPFIMVVLSFIVIERRVRVSWVAAGFAVVSLLYPASEFYRNVLRESLTRPIADMMRDPGGVFLAIAHFASSYGLREWVVDGVGATLNRFDGLGILALIMRTTPAEVPFQGGWTIGYIFLFWIPRAVWPDKPPLSIGRWITENYTVGGGESGTSTGCTWLGEFYLNFGWLGIVFGMIVLGILFRVLHELLFARRPILPSLVAGISMINMTARGMGGGLLGLTTVFWAMAPLLVLHGIVRLLGATVPRRPGRASAGPREAAVAADPPQSPASA